MQAETVSEQEEAWAALKPLGVSVVPYLLKAYPQFSRWRGREYLLYKAIGYARVSDAAFELGILALHDKSKHVRYRACMLLAYSQREDALPSLRQLLNSNSADTAEYAMAAIDAIESKNHHFFVDRNHTGKSFWAVNEGVIKL